MAAAPCMTPSRANSAVSPQVYTRYGKCYTFNGDRRNPRVARQGGMGNGLEIMLDIQQEEYLPIWRETSETQCWGVAERDRSRRLAGVEGTLHRGQSLLRGDMGAGRDWGLLGL